jgi:ribosomal silencing factor RsfS
MVIAFRQLTAFMIIKGGFSKAQLKKIIDELEPKLFMGE